MLQRVGERGAVTTKMLSHGLRSRWPSSRCEVCEASGQQPPVAETVVASTGGEKIKPLLCFSQRQLVLIERIVSL